MSDFDGIAGQRLAWSQFVRACFDLAIESEQNKLGASGTVQFFNSTPYDPGSPLILQPIVWNAFPKELLRQYGRAEPLVQADRLWRLRAYGHDDKPGSPLFEQSYYRPQAEYCEWHVTRDSETNKIRKVTFTSEPPEYWLALAGTTLTATLPDGTKPKNIPFPGNVDRLLMVYRSEINAAVEKADLFATDDIIDSSGNVYARKATTTLTTSGTLLSARCTSALRQPDIGGDSAGRRRHGTLHQRQEADRR